MIRSQGRSPSGGLLPNRQHHRKTQFSILGEVSPGQTLLRLVGVARFELATPSSRTRCATRLRYTPIAERGVL